MLSRKEMKAINGGYDGGGGVLCQTTATSCGPNSEGKCGSSSDTTCLCKIGDKAYDDSTCKG